MIDHVPGDHLWYGHIGRFNLANHHEVAFLCHVSSNAGQMTFASSSGRMFCMAYMRFISCLYKTKCE